MELLAIASALHLLNNTDHDSATIWSDCFGAVTTINNMMKFSKIGIKNNHPLFTTIHSILTANPNTQLKWCKAHPDIQLQQSWTHQQWGNHLADLVAGGAPLPTDLINVHSSTTISALEVATYIQPSWYWTHANSQTSSYQNPSMMQEMADGGSTNSTGMAPTSSMAKNRFTSAPQWNSPQAYGTWQNSLFSHVPWQSASLLTSRYKGASTPDLQTRTRNE